MPAAAFIVPAVASVATSLIGSHAAKSSASQQQGSGQSAASTFQPYVQGGNAALLPRAGDVWDSGTGHAESDCALRACCKRRIRTVA